MKKIFLLISVTLFMFYSCTNFLDVNMDVDNPADVEDYLILPSSQASLANVFSADYGNLGSFWAQHWAQNNTSSQYKSFESYALSGNDGVINRSYREMFSGALHNNEIILQRALSEENWGLYLMTATVKAYGYQLLVDLYDNVPYSEAFQGEAFIFSPHIDKGADIYAKIYDLLEDALSKDYSSFEKSRYAKYDLLGGGDLNKWQEFARSLQLRILIRQSAKNDVSAKIAALLANDVFLTTDVSLTNFEDVDSKANPLYEKDQVQLNTKSNIRANAVILYYFDTYSDPRKEKLFDEVNGEYLGVITGSYDVEDSHFIGDKETSRPTWSYDMPVHLMTVAEVELLKAEAYLKAGNAVNAKAAYDAGVTASFARIGAGDASAFLAPGGAYSFDDAADKLEAIIMQKWVDAADGQRGIEAFIERNRTGFPKESAVDGDIPPGTDLTNGGTVPYVAGTLVYSKLGTTNGKFPVRLPYADVEMNYNANAAEYKVLTDAVVMQTNVWWNK